MGRRGQTALRAEAEPIDRSDVEAGSGDRRDRVAVEATATCNARPQRAGRVLDDSDDAMAGADAFVAAELAAWVRDAAYLG